MQCNCDLDIKKIKTLAGALKEISEVLANTTSTTTTIPETASTPAPETPVSTASVPTPANVTSEPVTSEPVTSTPVTSTPVTASVSKIPSNTVINYGPFGSNLSIRYGDLITVLTNILNTPSKNKGNIPQQQLQSLLNQVKTATNKNAVETILRKNNIDVSGGRNVSEKYISISVRRRGGTRKRRLIHKKARTIRRKTSRGKH